MLQSNKRYKERNIKRIPKKVGVKVMEIKSILIKDTTREERKQIVEESFGNISASCDGCMAGLAEMYQEYIDGTKEIRDINMEFNAHYVREDLDEKSKRSCPMQIKQLYGKLADFKYAGNNKITGEGYKNEYKQYGQI